jgi:alpha,alpha-trehalose phosphorylase
VIDHPAFTVEPWALRETELQLDVLAQAGSVFALANGHIGLRGNLDEGEPNGLPGSYLNGFYEGRPLPYAEAGYGYPEAGQTIVNVTNGKIIRLLVDDEPFDVRFGECRSHERILDFRAGVLRREVDWRSPAGRAVKVSTVRLVSFVQRAVAAMLYEVEPLDSSTRLSCSRSSSRTSRCRTRPTIRAPARAPCRRFARSRPPAATRRSCSCTPPR